MAAEGPYAAPRAGAEWLRHEIRNPLNVMVGSLRLIEMAGVTPQQQKAIDQCRAAIDRITSVLEAAERAIPAFVADAASELRALGGVTFLAKPFERSDLLRTVQLAARTHRNLRLLAADDVPEIGWLLESLLESTGATLEVVGDGAKAIERAAHETFSVILLDLEMPGVNGLEAARAIREHERQTGRDPVPIVIASGHDLNTTPVEPDADGGDDTVRPDPEIAPLVPEFLENRRNDITRVNALIAGADWDDVRSLGHKMKGTGRGYGFARITEIGGALEQAGMNEDAEAARHAVEALQRYLDRVRVLPPEEN
jgi:CheY-like chemotaxis protein